MEPDPTSHHTYTHTHTPIASPPPRTTSTRPPQLARASAPAHVSSLLTHRLAAVTFSPATYSSPGQLRQFPDTCSPPVVLLLLHRSLRCAYIAQPVAGPLSCTVDVSYICNCHSYILHFQTLGSRHATTLLPFGFQEHRLHLGSESHLGFFLSFHLLDSSPSSSSANFIFINHIPSPSQRMHPTHLRFRPSSKPPE